MAGFGGGFGDFRQTPAPRPPGPPGGGLGGGRGMPPRAPMPMGARPPMMGSMPGSYPQQQQAAPDYQRLQQQSVSCVVHLFAQHYE